MKKDKYQSLPLAEKMLKLKESYLLGNYEELIIHDEYIYPPIEKDIKQILISQFGISLLDEYIRNYSQEKLNKKNKFPLPIIFAFIHHHIRANKYENLIRIIMQHVDRKGVEHYYILIYIIAKIYEKFKEYKKSIFYLENLLKESPFFSQGVYDLCYHYAFKFQRELEACNILERHIGHCQPNEKHIHSLYVYICSKFKVRNAKDVLKNLNNKSMNLIAYFNLGIYLRQADDLEKSYEIFNEIIARLSKAKLQQSVNYTQKDEKLLLLSKINLLMVLNNPNFQEFKTSESVQLLSNQIASMLGYSLDHQIISKLSQHKHNLNSFSTQSLKSQKIFRNYYSTRKSKQISTFKQYKQEKTVQNEQKSIQNKQNQKLNSFNNDFTTLREHNNKKLKYLLEKQKQINHFFKNLVIRKDENTDKMQIQYKINENPSKAFTNDSSIIKAKSLNNNQFQFFQKQFENKRKLHQFKYDSIELGSMLTQIMTNFQNCVATHKKETKIASIAKNYAQSQKTTLPRQNLQPSRHIFTENPPKTSHYSRKTDKTEKRAPISQISNRALKSDRGGNFRIKQASKQPQEIRQEKQQEFLLETKEIIILPNIHNIHKENRLNKVQQNLEQLTTKTQQKVLQPIGKQQKTCEYSKSIQGDHVLMSPQASQHPEIILQASNPVDQQKQSQHCIEYKRQNIFDIIKQEQQRFTEKDHAQQSQCRQQDPIQITDKVQNCIFQSHTRIMVCQQKQQSNNQLSQKQAQLAQKKAAIEDNHSDIPHKTVIQAANNIYQDKIQIEPTPIEEKKIQKSRKTPQQQKIISPAEQKTIKGQEKSKQSVEPTDSKPAYDPFASSFQLTGFGKASLSKFRELKKKKKCSPRQSVKKQIQQSPQPSSKKIEQIKPPKTLNPFQVQIKQGQSLEAVGKYEEAYQLYTKLYKTYKKQTQKQIVLIKIGSLFEAQQKFAEAEKTYLKCTKFNNVEAFIKLGGLLLKNGRINSGVENIQKANCLKRNDIEIQNKLVYGYSLREQTMEKALNLAQMILKKEPQSLETLIITANILQKQGKIKEAIDIMTAIDKFKSAQYIKHYLGILYLQDSNLTQAFNHFKAALSIQADYLPSLIEVATIISEISPKQSISILQKVLEIEPQNRKALARLGKIYESIENDFESAMAAYQTALETQQNYESYMKIGDCLARQQSYIEALINYKQALNMKKTHEAYAKVASMFQMKEQFSKAVENYELALNLLIHEKDCNSSKRKEYLTYLGNLSLKIGNYDAGIKFFQDIDDYEESIQILKLLAEAYFGKKQYSIALEKYEKASELAQGKNLDILENIAICFDKLEEYLASKAIYEKILEKDPENIKCMNNLANILLITGETNESFYLFESMLQKAPKNLEKRLKVVDIYAQVGDWSKVEFHLLHCLKQKENDERVIERLINLYKEKRDVKMANKYEKKLAIIKNNRKAQQKIAPSS